MKKQLLLFLLSFLCLQAIYAQTYYVDANVVGGAGDGSSWDDAFSSLQDALDIACMNPGTAEIWVAQGTYYPDEGAGQTNDARSSTFQLCSGVALYGGFSGAGTETMLGERDFEANATILNGDLQQDDAALMLDQLLSHASRSDNAYSVVTGSGTDATAVLDGFTVTRGNSDGVSDAAFFGGGMFNDNGSPTVNNCIFTINSAFSGGGMVNQNGASALVTSCDFLGNYSPDFGAGMYIQDASLTVKNCTFSGNEAGGLGGGMIDVGGSGSTTIDACSFSANKAIYGGGIYFTSSLAMTNCVFVENQATDEGGGMHCNGDDAKLINCLFSGNTAGGSGGGIYISNDDPSLVNCIFLGNKADDGGGLFNLTFSFPSLTNCTFSGNVATNNGGAIYNFDKCDPTITNCIIWNNEAGGASNTASASIFNNDVLSVPPISYSIIENSGGSGSWDTSLGTDNGNNKDADPAFVTPVVLADAPTTAGNLRLRPGSPAINMGNNAAVPADAEDLDEDSDIMEPTPDLDLNSRIQNATVDLGAYEFNCNTYTDGIVYVNASAITPGDGSSWGGALLYLQDALYAACNCANVTEIWVAQGTYYPDDGAGQTNNNRFSTFQLCSGVAIYGGFSGNGTETMLSERDFVANATILNGDLNQSGNPTGNAYSVVTGSGTDATAILDGFTITMGNANDGASLLTGTGGGIFNDAGSPMIANCNIIGNSSAIAGPGMFNTGSSPMVINCLFSGNSTSGTGGGMENFNNSSPLVVNCIFSGNNTGNGGAGMENRFSSPTLINCVFSGNSTSSGGGGMENRSSSPAITNCTFSGNRAGVGGGIYNESASSPTIVNTIIWNNEENGVTNTPGASIGNSGSTPTISYSIVANSGGSASWDTALGTDNGNNKDEDPLFTTPVDPATAPTTAGNLRLRPGSPAIDMGNDAAVPADTKDVDGDSNTAEPTPDLALNDRIQDVAVDMGAYEFSCGLYADGIVYVDANNATPTDGTSWAGAFSKLQTALEIACNCSSAVEIWVAQGTYYPDEGAGQTDDGQSSTFQLCNGVALYGGFSGAGTETMRSERDVAMNVTILSGDLQQNDAANILALQLPSDPSRMDNTENVVTGSGTDATAILDGFTVTGGRENSSTGGGGMINELGSPMVANCTFSGNSAFFGGGMVNVESAPMILNCIFSGNAAVGGGGMLNFESSPIIVNCVFSGNAASGGGGLANLGSSPMLTNCVFSGNFAEGGGGVYNIDSSPALSNCTISGNSVVSDGGGMYNEQSSSPVLANCILWNNEANGLTNTTSASIFNDASNPAISYSIIANSGGSDSWDTALGTDNGNNKDQDPLFVTPVDPANAPTTAGGLRLPDCSPAIDMGNDGAVPADAKDVDGDSDTGEPTPDLDLNGRIFGLAVDMGAYESQTSTSLSAVCQNQTVQLDANGAASFDLSLLDGGSTGCTPLSFTVDGQSSLDFTCANVGGLDVTLTVTDVFGGTSTCDAAISIEDNVDPEALCQDVTVQLDASGSASLTAAQVDNGSNDACGIGSLSLGGLIPVSSSSRLLYDPAGMQTTPAILDFTVENNDVALSLTATDKMELTDDDQTTGFITTLGGDVIDVITDFGMPAGADFLRISNFQAIFLTEICFNPGSPVFSYVDKDGVTQMLTPQVSDDGEYSFLTITGPIDAISPVELSGVVYSACDPPIRLVEVILEGQYFGPVTSVDYGCSDVGGAPAATLTVTDVNGNTSTCSATVTVEDNIPPAIICPPGDFFCLPGDVPAAVMDFAAFQNLGGSASDNCGLDEDSFTHVEDVVDDCFLTRTYRIADNSGNEQSCTQIFAKPGDWLQLGMDVSGETLFSEFGFAASSSGDGQRFAVGAPQGINELGQNTGLVYVYEWDGTAWVQLGSAIEGQAEGEQIGRAVSLSADGNRVVIGAPLGNGLIGDDQGLVRIYEWSGTQWNQVGEDIEGEDSGDFSGIAVSISDDGQRVAIGADLNDDSGNNAGHVRIYEWNGAAWVQLGDDLDGEAADDRFGNAVSLSGDGQRVAIGAFLNDGLSGSSFDDRGHVRIYEWDGTQWNQLGDDIDGDAQSDFSGRSVSLSANGARVAIGAIGNDDGGNFAGQVRVYEWNGLAWVQVGSDIDGVEDDEAAGSEVSLSANGNRLAIGAPGNTEGGSDAGQVRIYEWDGTDWVQIGSSINGLMAEESIGSPKSLSLSDAGDRVGFGTPLDKGAADRFPGAGRVYEYNCTDGPSVLLMECPLTPNGTTAGFTLTDAENPNAVSNSSSQDVDDNGQPGTDPDISVSYYGSEMDAENGENPITDNPFVSGETTVYARVENTATGCVLISAVTLIIKDTPEAPAVENATACSGQEAVLTASCPFEEGFTLYGNAQMGEDGPSSFYAINPATGEAVLIGETGFERCSNMAIDPTTGVIYSACERSDGSNMRVLITIDPSTGAGTEVAAFSGDFPSSFPMGGPTGLFDLSFTTAGDLYFIVGAPDLQLCIALLAVNKNTAATTLVGDPLVGTGTCAPGNAFDIDAAGQGWHVDENLGTLLYQLSLATGISTPAARLNFVGFPGFGEFFVNSMDIDPASGIAYVTVNDNGGSSGMQYLATIDLNTVVFPPVPSDPFDPAFPEVDINFVAQTQPGLNGISFKTEQIEASLCQIIWYGENGEPVGEGNTFDPVAAGAVDIGVSSDYSFFAECICINGCPSARTEATFTISTPVAGCQDVTVQLDDDGEGSTSAAAVNDDSFAACGIADLSLSKQNFDCGDVGNNTVTLTVTDVNGNASTCTATVTVEDNVAPVADCEDVEVRLDENGEASIEVFQVEDDSYDACGIASMSISRRNFDCGDVGEKTVTLTVTDVNGNSSACTATVTVKDLENPEALCRDIAVQLGPDGKAGISPADIDNGSSDACGIDEMSLSQENFTCADVGFNSVWLTVFDESGNDSRCQATVTVEGLTLPPILYVDASAAPGGGGTSWPQAFDKLQDALSLACSCADEDTEIWVADGTYVPSKIVDLNNDHVEEAREATFLLCDGIAIYGGFEGLPGTEGDFSSRDISTYISILSGDLGGNGQERGSGSALADAVLSDNAYHVVSSMDVGPGAILDGFTVAGGRADGSGANESGGGMLNFNGDPTIANCIFQDNTAGSRGGGMANFGSSPEIYNCIFAGNEAGGSGGGMYNSSSSPEMGNCLFAGNFAGNAGGGMSNRNSDPHLVNNTFSGNAAGNRGGAINNSDSGPELVNCILWNNQADGEIQTGSASMYNESGAAPRILYSLIANSGGSGGWNADLGLDLGGNIDSDPLFTVPLDPADAPATGGDFHLQPSSPAIDAGDNHEATPAGLDGNPRPMDGDGDNTPTADMGVYEFPGGCPAPVAQCQDITVQVGPNGIASLEASQLDGGSAGCGPFAFSVGGQASLAFTCSEVGDIALTLTVTDAFNASSSCAATVTVEDGLGVCPCTIPADDQDADGVCDGIDNCLSTFNPDQSDLDQDGLGDACSQSICLDAAADVLMAYIEGLNLNSAVRRAFNKRLGLAASRFCTGASDKTVVYYLNNVIDYLRYAGGNSIPADEASYLIGQLERLIVVVQAGMAECCAPPPPFALKGSPGIAEDGANSPEGPTLEVFPNPFREQAAIRFYVPQAGPVRLEVFNLQGQRLRVLASGQLDAGSHLVLWDGSAERGKALESGIYLVRLTAGQASLVKKVSFVR